MLADQRRAPHVAHEVLQHWGLTPIAYLGGRSRQHWLVASGGSRLVLRGYAPEPCEDIDYELAVLRRVQGLGWPVSAAVEGPILIGERAWCLFTWLPGECRPSAESSEERRKRGHLLAELHESMACLMGMGQRGGFGRADELAGDPELVSLVRAYERHHPTEGHILRWHLDRAQQAFTSIDVEAAETLVLHGDFARWNLLFEDERLTGMLDFENTHLNYRVADFALSWRGDQDEVIAGYQEVHTLSDLDWQLLVPVYWSWIFIGVKKEIAAMLAGKKAPHGFAWQVKHLLKRSGLLAQLAPRYPERASGSC